MKKEELVKAVFEAKNEFMVLNGQMAADLDAPEMVGKIRVYMTRHSITELEDELKAVNFKIEKLNHTARTEAFYATPYGATVKARLEKDIEAKQIEWTRHEVDTTEKIDNLIKPALGDHWEVCKIGKGWLEIGIVNPKKNNSKNREFFFGQTLEIRYEQKWSSKQEVFEAHCGSCGGFNVEGGTTVGERAMFYAGMGRLLSDSELIASIKEIIKEAVQTENRISEEYNVLHNKLLNPISEVE